MSIDVDHVMVHARRPVIGHTRGQLRVARTRRFDEAQRTAGQRHDDVIQRMHVLASLCTRGEGPLGHDYTFVIDLNGWNGFHVLIT